MRLLTYCLMLLSLIGCAGSASHDVVSAYQAGDTSLSCGEIDQEIIRAQVVIEEVNEDKSGLSGPDVIDGLLYFPFNLAAKSQNYKNALSAADNRIERLENLKKDNECSDTSKEMEIIKSTLADELRELTQMYKNGDLTKTEYQKAKNKLLSSD